MLPLQLALLGPLQVALPGQPAPHFATVKTQALLAYLAVEAKTAHARDTLLGLFWPDYPAASARLNLRQTLFHLRQAIPAVYLLTTRQTVQFDPNGDYSVDVTTFTDLLAACRQHAHADPHTCPACCERLLLAVDLYRGDFLTGFFVHDSPAFEEWLLLRREWLRREMLQALHQLSAAYEQRGEYDHAYRHAWRQVELDPPREEAHQQLIRVLALSGRRSEALAQYESCRRILAEELGVVPSAETTALVEQIKNAEYGMRSAEYSVFRTPHSALESPRHNLPTPLTSFIGRERELVEVQRLLTTTRLLTLTGAGGTGKTRLALQIARLCAECGMRNDDPPTFCTPPSALHLPHFADGVWWVELAPLADATLIAQTVATALGVHEQPGRLVLETLVDTLRSKQLLVVLDNCEHLVGVCAQVAETLLRAAPGLQMLTTSREVLGVAGEVAWRVPGLARPKHTALVPYTQLLELDAGRLFVERVVSAAPNFALTAQNAAAVVQICQRLDGLPLALELAAARAKMLTIEQIAQRLDDRFRLLTSSSRTVSSRQQTLRATIDWSYALLTAPEQALLRQLAVFAGGFMLEAAETICDVRFALAEGESTGRAITRGGLAPASPISTVLDLLSHLVDKSLVVVDQLEQDTVRYRLLETIRQYAWERLVEHGEQAAVQERHARCFLALAELVGPQLHSRDHVTWRTRLEVEHDNLRAALTWSLTEPTTGELGLQLVEALKWFWEFHFSEGCGWLERALAYSAASGPTPARARVLREAGSAADSLGDVTTALARLEESATIWRALGDTQGLAHTLIWLADVHQDQGDLAGAHSLVEESLALAQAAHDPWAIAWSLNYLAYSPLTAGDLATAHGLFDQALVLFRQVDDQQGIAIALNGLGVVAEGQADYTAAQALFEEALGLFRQLDNKILVAMELASLGLLAQRLGDSVQTHVLLTQSLSLAQEFSFRHLIPLCLIGLAAAISASGDLSATANEQVTRLLGGAQALCQAIDLSLPARERTVYEQTLATLHATMTETAFVAAWAAGQAMTLAQAVDYALAVAEVRT